MLKRMVKNHPSRCGDGNRQKETEKSEELPSDQHGKDCRQRSETHPVSYDFRCDDKAFENLDQNKPSDHQCGVEEVLEFDRRKEDSRRDAEDRSDIGDDERQPRDDPNDQGEIDADHCKADAVQSGKNEADRQLPPDECAPYLVDFSPHLQNRRMVALREKIQDPPAKRAEIAEKIEKIDGNDQVPQDRYQKSEGRGECSGQKYGELVDDVEGEASDHDEGPRKDLLKILSVFDADSFEGRVGNHAIKGLGMPGQSLLRHRHFLLDGRHHKGQQESGGQDEAGEDQADGTRTGDSPFLQGVGGRVQKIGEQQSQEKGDGDRPQKIEQKSRKNDQEKNAAVEL